MARRGARPRRSRVLPAPRACTRVPMASERSRLSNLLSLFTRRSSAREIDFHVTLWPSFPHFPLFAKDKRLAGIRLNSAQMSHPELKHELELVRSSGATVPLFFDVKGRQLRVIESHEYPDHLELVLNHRINVDLAKPLPVLFKAGADCAALISLGENGKRLIFDGGPYFRVKEGESLHIRHSSLKVYGPIFTEAELEKIARVRQAGFKRYFLSYVEGQRDIDEFQELVGREAEIWLKIENQRGLEFVANDFRKKPNLTLVTARGDLYVEVERPHQILAAVKMIIEKDPEACVGSRILLSVIQESIVKAFTLYRSSGLKKMADWDQFVAEAIRPGIPSCSDWHELAWLYDIGYRKMMLCDELCLKEDLLVTAVNAFDCFRKSYARDAATRAA